METTYAIIKALQGATGDLAKQAILDAQAGNTELAAYLKAVYSPAISYYQSKVPKGPYPWNLDWSDYPNGVHDLSSMHETLADLSSRKVSGKKAVARLHDLLCSLSPEGKELVSLVINRKIGADVGDTMVLKAFPGLYFIPPYQRCSLLDAKAEARFRKLKRFFVQTKADGSFAYIVKRLDGTVDVITRQGSTYPQAFAQELAKDVPNGYVVIGELEVTEPAPDNAANRVLLDRKTGNGILNSVLKDGEGLLSHQAVRVSGWDMLTQAEFESGASPRPYEDRLTTFKQFLLTFPAYIELIYTAEVTTLAEAYAIYTEHTARGLEGCIIKDPASMWKNGTAKDIIKLKLKFEAEYRIKGTYEGEGEMKGMLGGVELETEDGALETNCGTGFSKKQRIEFWAIRDELVDAVCMASANDIIQSRDERKKPSLSLPVFEEIRYDKTVANTLPEVVAIVEAAKAGK